MTRESDDDAEDFAGSMEEFMKLQAEVDKMAKGMVDTWRTLVENREEIVPRTNAALARAEAAFYDGTQRELDLLGFRTVGDFEPVTRDDKPADQRAFYRFCLSADGHDYASVLVMPRGRDKEPLRLFMMTSTFADGSTFATVRGLTGASIPHPPQFRHQSVPESAPVTKVVEAHRVAASGTGATPRALRGADDILESRRFEERTTAEWRREQGVEFFEPWLRNMLGEEYDERGEPLVESIKAHPWWLTGEEPKATDRPASHMPLMFLMSRDPQTKLGHITTIGMMLEGFPELQMKQLAGNHCRAARFLIGVVAGKLLREREKLPPPRELLSAPFDLTLTRDDVNPNTSLVVMGGYPEVDEPGPVSVRLSYETFDLSNERKSGGLFSLGRAKEETKLWRLMPPAEFSGTKDEWLRVTCRRLGQDAPRPRPASSREAAMSEASESARARLPEVRAQWTAGFPEGQGLLVKTGLTTTDGAKEYVWVRVSAVTLVGVVGVLVGQPERCPGYTEGKEMRLADDAIFDFAIINETGPVEPGRTDITAQEFGVDLPARQP